MVASDRASMATTVIATHSAIKRLRMDFRTGESSYANRNALHRATHEIRKTFLGDYTAGFVSEMMNYRHEETAEGYRWGIRDAEIERAEDDDLI